MCVVYASKCNRKVILCPIQILFMSSGRHLLMVCILFAWMNWMTLPSISTALEHIHIERERNRKRKKERLRKTWQKHHNENAIKCQWLRSWNAVGWFWLINVYIGTNLFPSKLFHSPWNYNKSGLNAVTSHDNNTIFMLQHCMFHLVPGEIVDKFGICIHNNNVHAIE